MPQTKRTTIKTHRATIGGVRRKGAQPLPEDDEYLTDKGKRIRGADVPTDDD